MRTKGLIGLIIIALLTSGWFFYKWQQHAGIVEEKLYEFTDDVILNLRYFTQSELDVSEQTSLIHFRLMNAGYAVEYTRNLYHVNADVPLEPTEATYLYVFQDILKNEYLPIAESIKYSESGISEQDKEKIGELFANLKEAGFPQDPVSVIGWSSYIQAVEEFLRLEGRITEEDAIVM